MKRILNTFIRYFKRVKESHWQIAIFSIVISFIKGSINSFNRDYNTDIVNNMILGGTYYCLFTIFILFGIVGIFWIIYFGLYIIDYIWFIFTVDRILYRIKGIFNPYNEERSIGYLFDNLVIEITEAECSNILKKIFLHNPRLCYFYLPDDIIEQLRQIVAESCYISPKNKTILLSKIYCHQKAKEHGI